MGTGTLVTNGPLLQTGPTAPIGYHPCGPSARATISPLQLWGWALQREVTCQVAWLTGMAPFLEQSYTLNTCGVAGPQALAREDKPGIIGLGQCWDLGSMALLTGGGLQTLRIDPLWSCAWPWLSPHPSPASPQPTAPHSANSYMQSLSSSE